MLRLFKKRKQFVYNSDNHTIRYEGLDGKMYKEQLNQTAVSGVILHATPDENIKSIQQEGLKVNMPKTKLMVDIPALFCTVPSKNPGTNDLFRYYNDWSVVVIDLDKIPNHEWYEDFLAEDDPGNNHENPHIMTFGNIPKEAIKEILKY